jgi:hypothetical protein
MVSPRSPPPKLEEIWLWGLSRNDPNPDIDLTVEGIPFLFNYYADVFYGEDCETELGSYYESSAEVANETEVPPENVTKVTGELTPPQPETPREQRFLEEFERKLREQPSPPTVPPQRPRPKVQVPGQLEIASWLPVR